MYYCHICLFSKRIENSLMFAYSDLIVDRLRQCIPTGSRGNTDPRLRLSRYVGSSYGRGMHSGQGKNLNNVVGSLGQNAFFRLSTLKRGLRLMRA